jgi:thioredoxin 1
MRIAAALLLAVMCFSACEGGCGEPAPEKAPSDGGGQTVSGTSSGGGGGDAIPLTGRKKGADDNPLAAPKAEPAAIRAASDVQNSRVQPAANPGPASAAAPGASRLAAVTDVMPADFDKTVLKSPKPVLMLYLTASCRACSSVEFALGNLAKEYQGKVTFARMDLNRPGAYELLPSGLRRLPLPAMAFYQDGSPLNIRQNIPVPADSSSLLSQWLRRVVDGRDVRLN